MSEYYKLFVDTRYLAQNPTYSSGNGYFEINYTVPLSDFGFGNIRSLKEVTLNWIRFENWSGTSGLIPPYLSIYIDEFGDFVLADNKSSHHRSTFVIPFKNIDNLIVLSEPLGNRLEFLEPVSSIDRLTVSIRTSLDLRDSNLLHNHSMLFTIKTDRKVEYGSYI